MENEELKQLLYEALETEMGGVKVYEMAIQCAINEDLKTEWQEYLEQTRNHVTVVGDMFEKLGLDPEMETPGRQIVRHIGQSLVKAIGMAKQSGKPEAAEMCRRRVCWPSREPRIIWTGSLIGLAAKKIKGETGKALKEAYEEVEDEEDEHLYRTKGWSRELWMQAMNFPAVIPPPKKKRTSKPL